MMKERELLCLLDACDQLGKVMGCVDRAATECVIEFRCGEAVITCSTRSACLEVGTVFLGRRKTGGVVFSRVSHHSLQTETGKTSEPVGGNEQVIGIA